MFKKIKVEYIVILLVMILFASVSVLSFTSMSQMQGNARVVNYAGIVRGATQRLVKKELMGDPSDELMNRLDSIVTELITGEGPNDLIVLQDEEYLDNMYQVQAHWSELKELIAGVRAGGDPDALFESSERYFVLVDETVSSAERFSEKQVGNSMTILLVVNVVVLLIIIIGVAYFIRTARLKHRAETLGKIAYVDPLTQMPNRASCEREIDRLKANPPEGDIAVFMFDMNNLKRANDELGHQGGDRIIADFARIIKAEGEDFGFVGRYGGDEFLAIFENATESKALEYLARIGEKLAGYNILHTNAVEKISFAGGYVVENMKDNTVEAMIDNADKRMYTRKRQMKENKEA